MLIRTIFRTGQSLLAQASPYLSVCISWRNILGNRMGQRNEANKQAKKPHHIFGVKIQSWQNNNKKRYFGEILLKDMTDLRQSLGYGSWQLPLGDVVGDVSTV